MTTQDTPFGAVQDHNFDELIQDSLAEFLARRGLSSEKLELDRRVGRPTPQLASDASQEIAEDVLRQIGPDFPVWQTPNENQLKFDISHNSIWGRALESLDLLIRVAIEAGSNMHRRYFEEARQSQDFKFMVLNGLFARACQVSRSVMVLLAAGYGDAALSRWRTLHELSVYVSIILKYEEIGMEVAERFLDHGVVATLKMAKENHRQNQREGLSGNSKESLASFGKHYKEVVKKYEESFLEPYGWIAHIIPSPSLEKLEKKVGLRSYRAMYMLSNQFVHSNSYGLYVARGDTNHSIGISAGPISEGVALPGRLTAVSLFNIGYNVLMNKRRIRDIVLIRLLNYIKEMSKVEFSTGEKRLADLEDTTAS